MKWYEFYKNRINTTYQDYFEERYATFLDEILLLSNDEHVLDAGCGIGSVSKFLRKYNVKSLGFDKDPGMVYLAEKNNPNGFFYEADMLSVGTDALTVTHGVLEHFTDKEIERILRIYPNSIHYVPLEGYDKKSFGDERLLPLEYWLENFNISEHETFNGGLDLYFKA